MSNKYKQGDRVRIKYEGVKTYQVHTIYNNVKVSLGLYDTPEVEQGSTIHVDELVLEAVAKKELLELNVVTCGHCGEPWAHTMKDEVTETPSKDEPWQDNVCCPYCHTHLGLSDCPDYNMCNDSTVRLKIDYKGGIS